MNDDLYEATVIAATQTVTRFVARIRLRLPNTQGITITVPQAKNLLVQLTAIIPSAEASELAPEMHEHESAFTP